MFWNRAVAISYFQYAINVAKQMYLLKTVYKLSVKLLCSYCWQVNYTQNRRVWWWSSSPRLHESVQKEQSHLMSSEKANRWTNKRSTRPNICWVTYTVLLHAYDLINATSIFHLSWHPESGSNDLRGRSTDFTGSIRFTSYWENSAVFEDSCTNNLTLGLAFFLKGQLHQCLQDLWSTTACVKN